MASDLTSVFRAKGRAVRVLAGLAVMLATASAAAAQNAVDTALAFYTKGGAYCFRVAPAGVALSEESEWTVMMLTSASNHRNTFRIRSVDAGETGLGGSGLLMAGQLVNDVWKFDGSRSDFFQRFAEGIKAGKLRARIVRIGPPNLSQLSERDRADQYLAFADRGSKVSFDKVPDLSADEFLKFTDYVPD